MVIPAPLPAACTHRLQPWESLLPDLLSAAAEESAVAPAGKQRALTALKHVLQALKGELLAASPAAADDATGCLTCMPRLHPALPPPLGCLPDWLLWLPAGKKFVIQSHRDARLMTDAGAYRADTSDALRSRLALAQPAVHLSWFMPLPHPSGRFSLAPLASLILLVTRLPSCLPA